MPYPGRSPCIPVIIAKFVSRRDTLVDLGTNGSKLDVRLLGIDAPEIAYGKNPGEPSGADILLRVT